MQTLNGKQLSWSRPDEEPTTGYQAIGFADGTHGIRDFNSDIGRGEVEPMKRIGSVSDGNNMSDIFRTDSGLIVALYQSELQVFEDRDAWVESMPDFDQPEALEMLKAYDNR